MEFRARAVWPLLVLSNKFSRWFRPSDRAVCLPKNAIHNQQGSGKVLAVSGTTSTAAMISCCAHYLVNIAPVLGIAGALSIIAQYQIQLFWVGLAFNLGGIVFIANKLFKFKN